MKKLTEEERDTSLKLASYLLKMANEWDRDAKTALEIDLGNELRSMITEFRKKIETASIIYGEIN